MKTTILILSLLITMSAKAQQQQVDITPDPVELHLDKHKGQYQTGKAFMWTGAGIIAASAGFLFLKHNEGIKYAQATALIGGAFSICGFIHAVDADRHKRKSWAAERTAIK